MTNDFLANKNDDDAWLFREYLWYMAHGKKPLDLAIVNGSFIRLVKS